MTCKTCKKEDELIIFGQDVLHETEGLNYYPLFQSTLFEFGFRDYDKTLVITCKSCKSKVSINHINGNTDSI